jgi:RNA polymerase sigma-32 factor
MGQLALTSNRFPAVGSESGLPAYLAAIKKFPLLSKEEEFYLAKRLEEHGDIEAAHKLVTSHMRLVVKIARANRSYGIPLSDLISEGNIGLLRAVKGFEADRGFRLATYAMWWIRAAIYECILNSWSLVKIGTQTAQKRLFFNLGKAKTKLGIYDNDIPRAKIDAIAEQLHVTPDEVADMNRRLTSPDKSLNQPAGEFNETERQDFLVDPAPSQETTLAEKEDGVLGLRLLKKGLAALSDRERRVIEQRRLTDNPRTLDDIGADFGISRERVRQIEKRAFQKLQATVRQDLAAMTCAPASTL